MTRGGIETVDAPPASLRIDVEAIAGDAGRRVGSDVVSIEEPLEIRLSWHDGEQRLEQSISITMRTPGNDGELALGFLAGEGIVSAEGDVRFVEPCGPPSPDKGIHNVVRVELADHVAVDPGGLLRHFYTTSSCGVCGKASLDAVRVHVPERGETPFSVPAAALQGLPAALRTRQTEFARTGGLHAAASFDADGTVLRVREDIGRHNAFDKLAGSYLSAGGLAGYGILLSGRASFELLQKAAVAGTPMVASIGPPSSLAVELAEDQGITLAGFLKADRFNVYTRPDRIL